MEVIWLIIALRLTVYNCGLSPRTRYRRPTYLVGHSEAGYYEPLYADRYPREVAGIVLVDPSFPNDEQEFDPVSPAAACMDASTVPLYHLCYEGALHGKVAEGSARYTPSGFPPHWREIFRAQCAQNGPAFCALGHVQLETELLRPAFWLDSGSEILSDVDATIIAASSSTKNASGQRDPEMHQTILSRPRRLTSTTAICFPSCCRAAAADFTYRCSARRKGLSKYERARHRSKARVRARVEHPFHVVKRIFGFVKVRYRGIAKNAHRLVVNFALANLYLHRRRLLESGA